MPTGHQELDPRERMRVALRQRVPAVVLTGGAVASARYRESAALLSRYLARDSIKSAGGFVEAMNALFFMEACAAGRIGADALVA